MARYLVPCEYHTGQCVAWKLTHLPLINFHVYVLRNRSFPDDASKNNFELTLPKWLFHTHLSADIVETIFCIHEWADDHQKTISNTCVEWHIFVLQMNFQHALMSWRSRDDYPRNMYWLAHFPPPDDFSHGWPPLPLSLSDIAHFPKWVRRKLTLSRWLLQFCVRLYIEIGLTGVAAVTAAHDNPLPFLQNIGTINRITAIHLLSLQSTTYFPLSQKGSQFGINTPSVASALPLNMSSFYDTNAIVTKKGKPIWHKHSKCSIGTTFQDVKLPRHKRHCHKKKGNQFGITTPNVASALSL